MNRNTICLIAILLIIIPACKKKEVKKDEGPIAKKFAKYRVSAKKDRDLKNWLATLEKTEEVDLLLEEDYTNPKGKTYKLSKIKLSDDKVGYIKSSHLANSAVVFMNDVKAHVRPTSGSKVKTTIPKGIIGFIIAEKGEWAQVYAGKINNIWITKHWIRGGYTTEPNAIIDAKEYEKALAMLKGKEVKKETLEKVIKNMEELSKATSIIAEIAKEKLREINENRDKIIKEEKGKKKTEEESKDIKKEEIKDTKKEPVKEEGM
ncbi:hypothetical protein ACFL20_05285 [Spirochaetota bacterium]